MGVFDQMVKSINDDNMHVASSGKSAAEYTGSIDTGSYMLNAVISGSIFGGFPNNKITMLAGEESTGKTFYALSMVKSFLEENPEAAVFYFDTEAAVTSGMMAERGIDTNRVYIVEPDSVESFRHKALQILDSYSKKDEDERPPMMFVLDSLGQLSTSKELEDTSEGKETRDMTRAQMIKSTFRVLTLKLARLNVPMIVTNHVYAAIGSTSHLPEVSGGSGTKYAASQIVLLSKSKEKEGTDQVGVVIKARMLKSRFTKEGKVGATRLTFDKGLDRHYGLLDICEKYGVFSKLGNKYIVKDGTKQFGKTILKKPEKFFTEEVLEEIDEACKKEFMYGNNSEVEEDAEEEISDTGE